MYSMLFVLVLTKTNKARKVFDYVAEYSGIKEGFVKT